MNVLRVILLLGMAGSLAAFFALAAWTSVHYGPLGLIPVGLLDTMTCLLLACTGCGLVLVMIRGR